MCGIVGVISSKPNMVSEKKLIEMTSTLAHRGPDGSGHWISPDQMIGFGHRRLAVVDLSELGAQPMMSHSGRYAMTYNGEIYNFLSLRKELENLSHTFAGDSDSEVILAACEEWGFQTTLERLNGMFVIAIWDKKNSELLLARDRVGIKPVYYSSNGGEFTFASELRPLVFWRGEVPPISNQGLTEFFRLGYVPSPLSIFDGIHKLEPGQYLVFKDGEIRTKKRYWSLNDIAARGSENQFESQDEAVKALEEQLDQSVSSQMVSDVPLGAFLSGGIDSSTVVSVMQKLSTRPVKTFSIGFDDESYNEAKHAARISKHLGTDHHELYVSEQQSLDVVPSLAEIYDEPFADVSQIPTSIVSKLAREHVTVALSGDGGDELFAGYNRYVFTSRFWNRIRKLPRPLRQIAGNVLSFPSEQKWDALIKSINAISPNRMAMAQPGQKIHKAAAALPSKNLQNLHSVLTSKWTNPHHILNETHISDNELFLENFSENTAFPPAIQQTLWDSQTYMVDDILSKVDRASMNVGLEARVPLLDHEMVEFAWRVPLSMKIKGDTNKWVLRKALEKHVPREMFERPKMGFAVPIDNWLRGELKDWAVNYIDPERVDREGYLNSDEIQRVWKSHQNGKLEAGSSLWTVLIFQQWLEKVKQWV